MGDIQREIRKITETREAEVIAERNLAETMIKAEGNHRKMTRNIRITMLNDRFHGIEKHKKEKILCLLIPFHRSHHLDHLHRHAQGLEAASMTNKMIN